MSSEEDLENNSNEEEVKDQEENTDLSPVSDLDDDEEESQEEAKEEKNKNDILLKIMSKISFLKPKEKVDDGDDPFSSGDREKEDIKKIISTVLILLALGLLTSFVVKQVRDTQEEVINARIWKITGIPRVVVTLPKIKSEDLYKKSQKALAKKENFLQEKKEKQEKKNDIKEVKKNSVEEEYSEDPFEDRKENRLKESLKIQKNQSVEKDVDLDIPPFMPPYAPVKDEDPFAIMKVPSLSKIKAVAEVPAIPPPDAESDLVEKNNKGEMIPKVSVTGLKPWMKYARDFSYSPKVPRIGIIVRGLGLFNDITQGAIDKLPPDVVLSFSPYAKNIKDWMVKARDKGHEVMIDLPLEPENFPQIDTGPLSLLTNLPYKENKKRLETIMSKGGAFIGLCGYKGKAFVRSDMNMQMLLKEVANRGLVYINNVPDIKINKGEISIPSKTVDKDITDDLFLESVTSKLERLEIIANYKGSAIAILEAKPVTLQAINDWAVNLINQYSEKTPEGVVKQFILAPVSSLVTE